MNPFWTWIVLTASAVNEQDLNELETDAQEKGFVGALADWSDKRGFNLSNAMNVGGGQKKLDIDPVFERRQCTLPPEDVKGCACFEIFNMADLWLRHAKVDEEEYKQRFKRAAKLYHPDKGGSEEHMVHLKACSALLRDPSQSKVRKEYIVEMKKVLGKCSKQAEKRKMTQGECYRSEVEMLHDCETGICLSAPKALPSDLAGASEYTDKGIMERLVVLIDDSASMDGWKIESAKAALASVMPRIERTPTDVHFIRSRDGPDGFVSTQLFAYNDTGINYEDIAKEWKACCTTYLWEYTHGVVSGIVSPVIEVVLLTDGEDNDSPGEFGGPQGFSHMMKLFLVVGKQPRFRVYCIGNDACMGQNKYYRDLALATGGTFVSVDKDTDATTKREGLATFAEECNAPFQERSDRSASAKNQYQTLLLDGDAKKYDWADELRIPEKGPPKAKDEHGEEL